MRTDTNFIVVHNIEHVRRALSAAASLQHPITLLSPPDAAATIGPAVFRDMIRIASEEFNNLPVQVRAFIDCGQHAGHALLAIREGCTHIRIDAAPEMIDKFQDMLGSKGTVMNATPCPSLDLADTSVSDEILRDWVFNSVQSGSEPIHGVK